MLLKLYLHLFHRVIKNIFIGSDFSWFTHRSICTHVTSPKVAYVQSEVASRIALIVWRIHHWGVIKVLSNPIRDTFRWRIEMRTGWLLMLEFRMKSWPAAVASVLWNITWTQRYVGPSSSTSSAHLSITLTTSCFFIRGRVMSDQGWKHMTLLKKTQREENGDKLKYLDINKNGCHSFTSSYGQYQVLTFNHILKA